MPKRKLGGRDRQGERLTTYDAALIKTLGDRFHRELWSWNGHSELFQIEAEAGPLYHCNELALHVAAPGKGQEPGLAGSP